eukprot:1918350-Pyramimonas_sp.AAC.1
MMSILSPVLALCQSSLQVENEGVNTCQYLNNKDAQFIREQHENKKHKVTESSTEGEKGLPSVVAEDW